MKHNSRRSLAHPHVLGRWSLALSLGYCVFAAAAAPAPTPGPAKAAKTAATPSKASAPKHKSRFPLGGMPASAHSYYKALYGVDELSVQLTQSDQLVRFTYHVVDASKAQALQDRAATPNMFDEAVHAVLVVPVMEKVGPLRQSMPAKNGMTYWMAFSNRGGVVKAGHKVGVAIGTVRIDGLIVQ